MRCCFPRLTTSENMTTAAAPALGIGGTCGGKAMRERTTTLLFTPLNDPSLIVSTQAAYLLHYLISQTPFTDLQRDVKQ